jgi:hypothetical protein
VAAQVCTVTTVADVAGALGGTYFLISDPHATFYVWLDVGGASTDPAPDADYYGIEVDISSGATAAAVASAIEAALDLATGNWSASVADDVVTITALKKGAVVAAIDAGTSGFTVATTTAGADPYCLRVLSLIDAAQETYDDLPHEDWRQEGRHLLSAQEDAMIRYVGRIADADMETHVTQLLIQKLAEYLATKVAGGRTKKLDALGEYARNLEIAKGIDGRQRRPRREPVQSWADYK